MVISVSSMIFSSIGPTPIGERKILKKQGMTIKVPRMYHGALLPIGVLHLSDKSPTNGVVMPSASYPASITIPTCPAGILIT